MQPVTGQKRLSGILHLVDLANVLTASTAVLAVLASSGVSMYTLRRTAISSQEARVEQRAADGYLKLLGLVEKEGQFFEAWMFNFGLDYQAQYDDEYEPRKAEKANSSDRATGAALVAAVGSATVRNRHAAWRKTADEFSLAIEGTLIGAKLNGVLEVSDKEMTRLRTEFQAPERAAREALAESIATELGHR